MGVPLAIIHFRLEISITHQLFWVSPFMEPPINGILGYIKTFFINIPIYIYIYIYSNIPLENIFQYIRLIKKQQHIIKMAYVILIYIYKTFYHCYIYIYIPIYCLYKTFYQLHMPFINYIYQETYMIFGIHIFNIFGKKTHIKENYVNIIIFLVIFPHIFTPRLWLVKSMRRSTHASTCRPPGVVNHQRWKIPGNVV